MIEYRIGNPQSGEFFEIMNWCAEKFGTYQIDRSGRWVGGRWNIYYSDNEFKIKFTHSEDAVFFALKWA
jgi:hypothetical protein